MKPSEQLQLIVNECRSAGLGHGLCIHLKRVLRTKSRYLETMEYMIDFIKWKGWYSGAQAFPIAPSDLHMDKPFVRRETAIVTFDYGRNWDMTTEFGKRRFEVAKAVIQYLKVKEKEWL